MRLGTEDRRQTLSAADEDVGETTPNPAPRGGSGTLEEEKQALSLDTHARTVHVLPIDPLAGPTA